MKRQQVVHIHGGETFDTYKEYWAYLASRVFELDRLLAKKWRDSLGDKLGSKFEVIAPTMPNGHNAKYKEWEVWFKRLLPLLHHDVILIGHSLGGIFLAKYLSQNKFPRKINATFLIAAPFDDETQYSLGTFRLPKNLNKFAKQAGKIFLYQSEDDPIVPFSDVLGYQKLLPQATLRIFKKRQHFNQPTFPELIKEIKQISKK